VVFQVWGDTTLLYQSGTLTGSSATVPVSVNVTGRSELRLVVTTGGDNDGWDHADWANARLTCGGGGPTQYLSDLTWTSVTNGWGPVERDQSNGEQGTGDGGPLTLAGVPYAKGLGVHAASDVRYAIPSGCTMFLADVGLDDEVGGNGSVVFQVWGDTTLLYQSGTLTGSSATVPVSVDLTGRSALRLVVTTGGDNDGWDHADWANARFTCGLTAPQAANKTPSVTITKPSDGTSVQYRPGRAVTIEASASDSDGTVTTVYFFVNDVAVGATTTSPYSAQWIPPSPGSFSIAAVAVDNKGASTRSASITVTLR
jgi:hypothetical protein